MSDLNDWRVYGDNYGDVSLVHIPCGRDVFDPGSSAMTLTDALQAVDEHDCPGPPQPLKYTERCEHGAPVAACRKHEPVTYEIVRR